MYIRLNKITYVVTIVIAPYNPKYTCGGDHKYTGLKIRSCQAPHRTAINKPRRREVWNPFKQRNRKGKIARKEYCGNQDIVARATPITAALREREAIT